MYVFHNVLYRSISFVVFIFFKSFIEAKNLIIVSLVVSVLTTLSSNMFSSSVVSSVKVLRSCTLLAPDASITFFISIESEYASSISTCISTYDLLKSVVDNMSLDNKSDSLY